MAVGPKKKRFRTVILVSAVGAAACGGQVTDDGCMEGECDPFNTSVDETFVGDPVGEAAGGYHVVGTGGYTGTGGGYVGTGGYGYVGTYPGEPPYLGGAAGSGGDEE